jgi:predicted MFS family arabinose efflux permease
VVFAFGLGAFVFNFVQKAWCNPAGLKPSLSVRDNLYYGDSDVLDAVPSLFVMLGSLYGLMQLLGAMLLRDPPSAILVDEDIALLAESQSKAQQFNVSEMVRTYPFWLIAGNLFFNAQAVLFITNFEKVIGTNLLPDRMTDGTLTVIASVSSICNGLGRISWGFLADQTSFRFAMGLMVLLQVVLIVTLGLSESVYSYALRICGIFFCIGGNFSMFPAATAIYFGPERVGSNYGVVFMASGIAMLWGAWLMQLTSEHIKSDTCLSIIVAGLVFCGSLCTLALPSPPKAF